MRCNRIMHVFSSLFHPTDDTFSYRSKEMNSESLNTRASTLHIAQYCSTQCFMEFRNNREERDHIDRTNKQEASETAQISRGGIRYANILLQ